MTYSDDFRALRGSTVRGQLQENQSWQRNDLGKSGRPAGRDYYDIRSRRSDAAPIRPITSRDAARLLRLGGLALIAAGTAAWVWLILAFVGSIGSGNIPDDPFGARLSGIPLSSGGLVTIVAGALLATVGSWLARAAYSRRERIRMGMGQGHWI